MQNYRNSLVEKESEVHPWKRRYETGESVLPEEKDMPQKWFDRARKRLQEQDENNEQV